MLCFPSTEYGRLGAKLCSIGKGRTHETPWTNSGYCWAASPNLRGRHAFRPERRTLARIRTIDHGSRESGDPSAARRGVGVRDTGHCDDHKRTGPGVAATAAVL